MNDKFCLKWNDFKSNASKTFGLLRDEDFLQDVTLVGDDNSQIEAHKLVLSACSEYFKDIFKNNKHSHPLLCLEGVTSAEIKNILDYIYNGELNIYQEELDRFLEVAQRFKLEGLLSKEDDEERESEEVLGNHPTNTPQKDQKVDLKVRQLAIPTRNDPSKLAMTEEEKENLVGTVDQHLVRIEDGGWKCTLCRKSANGRNSRQQMRYHVEGKHLEGISLPCNLCDKTFRSRNVLNGHRSRFHK